MITRSSIGIHGGAIYEHELCKSGAVYEDIKSKLIHFGTKLMMMKC